MANTSDLSFSVLDLLNSERNAFGMREKDYERYRRHCSNKIHRLRQVTGATHGNGKTFKKVEKIQADKVKDVKTLHLLLFQAERALVFSEELQQEATAAKQSQNASTYAITKEQHSRIRKAVGYATELYDLAKQLSSTDNARLDALTLSEIAIYLLHVQAKAAFGKANHEDAIIKFVTRRRLLSLLSENAITSHAQALANQAMDEADPLIRFCAYKQGRKQAQVTAGGQSEVDAIVADFDDDALEEGLPGYGKLVKEVTQQIEQRDSAEGGVAKKMLEPIAWAGETIEIRNAEVVRAMVKAQAALNALQSAQAREKEEQEGVKKVAKMWAGSRGKAMKRWDAALAALGEAEVIARRQIVDDDENAHASGAILTSSSPSFIHQYILFTLLTYRIRRDLLFIDSMDAPATQAIVKAVNAQSTKKKVQSQKVNAAPGAKKPSPAQYAKSDISSSRWKREQALKSLQAVTKLYDTVVQSAEQISGLTIVEERENVWRGVNGFAAYVKAVKCVKLAQMHAILIPTPSYPSAIQLTNQASTYIGQSRASLFPSGAESEEDPIREPVRPVKMSDLDGLQTDLENLENAAKRAWFGQVVNKPLFYDTAFNYVDLPLEELERIASRGPASPPSVPVASVTEKVTQPVIAAAQTFTEKLPAAVVNALPASVKVSRESRGREATPAVEEEPAAAEKEQPKSTGWFGGLWGGKK